MRLVIPDLLPGTNYAIQVRADDGALQSEWGNRFEVTTIVDTVLPKVPANVTWISSGDSFYGTWDSVTLNVNDEFSSISSYEIELTGNGNTKFVTVPHQTGSKINYTLDFETNRALFGSPAATVEMRVRAVDQKNLKSAWSTLVAASNDAPAPVTNLVATPLIDQVGLKWDAPADNDIVGYNVYASTTPAFTPNSGNKVAFSASTAYTYSTMSYVAWHFVVRSVDKFGTEGIIVRASATPNSAFIVDTTPPPTPVITSAVLTTVLASSATSLKVDWTYASVPSDLSEFVIRYRPSGGAWEFKTITANAADVPLTATITGLLPYVNYDVQMRARDFTANESAWTATTVATGATNTAPSQPAAPTAAVNTLQIQVTHSGLKQAGGAMEADVAEYEVYASTSSGFTPAAANMLGKIRNGPAIIGTFNIPASAGSGTTQTWYVKVIAVDALGLSSSASPASSAAAVGLISTANIGDAQITTAKINSLEANKIVAGTGFINDLTVKSKFTLGDASTDGVIESYDYTTSSGVTGFRLAKSGLIIKTGAIEAAALRIQDGNNLMHPKYADFEGNASSYVFLKSGGAQTESIITSSSRFNSQSLRTQWAAVGSAPVIFMTPAVGTYNINVEAGQSYIVSAYVWNTGAVATSVSLGIAWGNAANGSVSAPIVATATIPAATASTAAVRISGVVTAPAGAVKAATYSQGNTLTSGAGYNLDGWQVERQIGSLTTPSPWKPPGSTSIDGGLIRTGEIRSTTTLDLNGVVLPTWSINMDGNATFGNLALRGAIVVGSPDEDSGNTSPTQARTSLQSYNYGSGNGWAIFSNGFAEFRKIVTGTFPGSAIEDGTLAADAIVSGSIFTKEMIVQGSIHTVGDMGEDIGIDGEGFHVLGPYQVAVTHKAVASNKVTLTTALNHGFYAPVDLGGGVWSRKKLVVSGLGEPYDGTWEIDSITANTVAYNVPSAPDLSTTQVFGGLAKSLSNSTSLERPKLIDFPTDGSNPNIISGTLSADTLTVSKGASLRGSSTLDNGSFVIAAGVLAPKSAPVVTQTYKTLPLTGADFVGALSITKGHDGHYYILNKDTSSYYVKKFDSVTGSYIATVLTNPISTSSGILFKVDHLYYPRSFIYSPTHNKYYLSITDVTTTSGGRPVVGAPPPTPDRNEEVWTYGTTLTAPTSFLVATDPGNDAGWSGGSMGLDYTDTAKLVRVLHVAGTGLRWADITLDGSGIPTSATAHTTLTNTLDLTDPRVAFRVNDLDGVSATRIIVKDYRANTQFNNNVNRWTPFNTSNAGVATEQWLPANDFLTHGGFYNTTEKTVYALNANGIVKYESGDSYWVGTAITSQRWVGHSWYDSQASSTHTVDQYSATTTHATIRTTANHGYDIVNDIGKWIEVRGSAVSRLNGHQLITGLTLNTITFASTGSAIGATSTTGTVTRGTYETQLSPIASVMLRKRAAINVTVGNIPYDVGEFPDKARVYVAEGSTMPTLTGTVSTSWKLRETIPYPDIAVIVNALAAPNGDRPLNTVTNTFSQVNSPSEIKSSTGNSYWKGDDTAQFYQLVINSATDVSSAAGNKPPLRIGDISGTHLRIDGNEIMAMSNTNTIGTLNLNIGGLTYAGGNGGTFRAGTSGKALTNLWFADFTGTANASGVVTINDFPTMPTSAYQVVITHRGGTGRFFGISSRSTGSFDVTVRDAAGALLASGAAVTLSYVLICP